jgi:hypothetical protein
MEKKDSQLKLFGENFNTDVDLDRGLIEDWIREDGTISPGAFTGDECSVNRNDMRTKEETLKQDAKWRGIGSVNNRYPKQIGLDVKHMPIYSDNSNENNIAHCVILGKKTGSIRKKLANNATLTKRN